MAAAKAEVRTDRRKDGVWVIVFDDPPANAMGPVLRDRLIKALVEAPAQGARAVVLSGAGRNFSAATEVDLSESLPSLTELCQAVEDCPVPVVAALAGAVVGPGASLALAADARVAGTGTRILFPEVGLGLVSGGGATQRLPRLVGAAEALAMLLRARPVAGPEAVAMGLVDVLAEEDVMAEALSLALRLAVASERGQSPVPASARRHGFDDVPAYLAAVAGARAETARAILPAPQRIVDCVEAALVLPFDNGVALETVARDDLAAGAESRGLIAAVRAERRAGVLPAAVAKVRPKTVARLGLSGSALVMAPLALLALSHGLAVVWAEPQEARRAGVLRWIDDRQAADLKAGRMSVVQRDADRARLSLLTDPADMGACDLVIHAGPGDALARLARALPEAPQLVVGGAAGQLGLALAPSARLVELALPEPAYGAARPEHVAVAVQFFRRMRLVPVLVGKMPIVGRRVNAAGVAALARLAAMGVPHRILEGALEEFGQPMPELPAPLPDQAVAPMREMTAEEVLRRWQGAMANEGLKLLDGRVALRPSDIDLVLVAGFGFPRWRGGPMHHAESRGLMVLRRDLRAWLRDDAALWTPHPLMDSMIAEGRRLADLHPDAGG